MMLFDQFNHRKTKEYRVMVGESGIFGLGNPIDTCGVFFIAYRHVSGSITECRGRILVSGDEKVL